jgi:hypothetical protein
MEWRGNSLRMTVDTQEMRDLIEDDQVLGQQ